MNTEINSTDLELREHRYGRFDKRLPIGPVRWDFHDLLWIHEGAALIVFEELQTRVELTAPAGVLILPGTLFKGQAVGQAATASVCHFSSIRHACARFLAPGHMLPLPQERMHTQNLVRLALELAHRRPPVDPARRKRLLCTILDGFQFEDAPDSGRDPQVRSRLAGAWEMAARNLASMRTLSDVAGLIGIRESGFRALHRREFDSSAGEYLRELRLKKAEELLATTGYSLSEIASKVGYAHCETLNAAFKKSRGKTPGQYRRWSNPFA